MARSNRRRIRPNRSPNALRFHLGRAPWVKPNGIQVATRPQRRDRSFVAEFPWRALAPTSLHPELIVEREPLRVELIVADALGDEVDKTPVVRRDDWRFSQDLALDLLPEQGGSGRIGRLDGRRVVHPGVDRTVAELGRVACLQRVSRHEGGATELLAQEALGRRVVRHPPDVASLCADPRVEDLVEVGAEIRDRLDSLDPGPKAERVEDRSHEKPLDGGRLLYPDPDPRAAAPLAAHERPRLLKARQARGGVETRPSVAREVRREDLARRREGTAEELREIRPVQRVVDRLAYPHVVEGRDAGV